MCSSLMVKKVLNYTNHNSSSFLISILNVQGQARSLFLHTPPVNNRSIGIAFDVGSCLQEIRAFAASAELQVLYFQKVLLKGIGDCESTFGC